MSNNVKDIKLGVIGCGKMADAILGGCVKNNYINKDNVFVYDINDSASANFSQKYGFQKLASIESVLKHTNCILLAVKPFVVDEVMNKVKQHYNNHLIASILAGVKIEKYLSYIKDAEVIRIMPNIPALVNEGMSAVCASQNTTEENFNFIFKLMKNCGKAVKIDESKIDIITALSGSGPAYYFKIIDLMAQAAVKLGLDYKDAILLSTQTALGSAKMVFENNFDINTLIKNVTTPGGCTEVGNNVLKESNIEQIIDKTIKDTMDKAIKLG